MDETLKKSLTDLIDETLMELDELRKSRFDATEIKIEGPGDGIAGKPSNGDLHAKSEDDKKDEDEDKDKDMDKAEGENRQADPNGGHHQMDKAEGENRQADPNGGHHQMDKGESCMDKADKDDKDEDKEGSPAHEEKEKKIAKELLDMHKDVKKSVEESESLMKSYVEERVKPLEDKLSTILDLVNKIADQPVPAKGQTARGTAAPLLKTGDAVESLSKTQVANKLFELKKSGTRVDSLDIAKAEMGQDLQQIAKKYEIS